MHRIALLVFASTLGVATPSAHSATAPVCAEIAGSAALLKPGALILLGEMHGTQEIPRFTGDLVCAATVGQRPVLLGLEIGRDEQARIADYLASDGSSWLGKDSSPVHSGTSPKADRMAGGAWRWPT